MNTSGEVADQIVRMSLCGVEVAAKITGAGAKQLALMLYSIMKDQKKTKGKTRLESMLKNGKELKVFSVRKEDLKKFTTEAKRYGVLYCVLQDKNGTDGLTDIFVRAEDSSKINRIIERFKIATVDTASIKSDIEKRRSEKENQKEDEKQSSEQKVPSRGDEDSILDGLITGDGNLTNEAPVKENPIKEAFTQVTTAKAVPIREKPLRETFVQLNPVQKEQAQNQNPTTAQTTKSSQSEPSSDQKTKVTKIFEPEHERTLERTRPSVREELSEIKSGKAKDAIARKDEMKQQKTNQHKAPQVKKQKTKHTREKG